jgi:type I restriction enzyme S subunit
VRKGWQTKKLGEVCDIQLGRTPARANAAFWDEKRETGNVWLSIADLLKSEDNIVVDSKEYVSDKGAGICKLVSKGTLLVSFKLTLGRLAFAGRDLFTNEAIAALTIFNESALSKKFLFYFLHYFDWVGAAENDVKLKGMTFNKAKLREIEVHFPEFLLEQQRIVGILDEAFAGIATAKANAEKNLQNARALFESHLNAVFSQKGDGWVKTTIGEATAGVFTGPFGSLLHKSDYIVNGIPLVNPAHIDETGIKPDINKTVSHQNAKRLESYIMHKGDIVIGRRGEMGRCALVTEVEDGWLCGTGSFFIRHSGRCSERYLVRFLRSGGCRERLEKLAGGTVMPNLSNSALGNLALDLPPLVQQNEIVEKIDYLSAETRHLESIYQQKLAALDALKKSLLHQAFSGAL